jgi:hypothetical protein
MTRSEQGQHRGMIEQRTEANMGDKCNVSLALASYRCGLCFDRGYQGLARRLCSYGSSTVQSM